MESIEAQQTQISGLDINKAASSFGFEGPEKNLEVCCEVGTGIDGGFRAISFQCIKTMLREVRCEVLERTHNQ